MTTYGELGFRTRRSVYWLAAVLLVAALNAVTIHSVQADQGAIETVAQCVWVVGVFLGTMKVLRRLGALEEACSKPDEGMKLAFHCATMLPVTGYLPLFIGV